MLIAVPKEVRTGETRVALVPSAVAALKKAGLDVAVESGAGKHALAADAEYAAAGARIEPDRTRLLGDADVLLTIHSPGPGAEFSERDLAALRPGAAIIGLLDPLGRPAAMQALARRGLTLLAMELIPRTTRAQSMDVLSSMATVAGYKAVLLGAEASPKMFPMLMTAAGTVSPAKVFVLGAGVAGLQAIATARRLGAVVQGYDIRPAVKEQVESLGARFVEIKVEVEASEGSGGYAAAQSEDFYRRQQELLAERLRTDDVIITTAAVPGKRAPILITEQMMDRLRPGTVIVDLAADTGGNCAATKPGERVERDGVVVLGPLNLAASAPAHASQMYSKNISTLLLYLVHDGVLKLNAEDEIVAGALVARDGAVVHPRVLEALPRE